MARGCSDGGGSFGGREGFVGTVSPLLVGEEDCGRCETQRMAGEHVEVSREPDPVIEAYKKDVDRSLLRERLKRSVEERLRDLMRAQEIAEELRRAGRKAFP